MTSLPLTVAAVSEIGPFPAVARRRFQRDKADLSAARSGSSGTGGPEILRVRESWLRTKAAARAIPCTFIGKHLRFSESDIQRIKLDGARDPATRRRRSA